MAVRGLFAVERCQIRATNATGKRGYEKAARHPIIAGMTEPAKKDGRAGNGGPRPKVREDDRRGHRGSGRSEFEAPQHIATDENRELVKTWIKVLTIDQVATKLGIGRDTLMRHYRPELDAGITDAVAAIGSKVLKQAMDGDKASQFFFLRTRGKWSVRNEITGPGGGPVQTARVDPAALESLTDEEFELYERLCERLGGASSGGDAGPGSAAGPDSGEAGAGAAG